jgi:hypothetical protein
MLLSPVYIEAHPRRKFVHPETGHSVRKPVAPRASTALTGTLYLFSFQSLAEPYSSSRSNRTPFISCNFIFLQTLSLATDGYTPSPQKNPACPERSRRVPTLQDPEIRPARSRFSLFTDHESRGAVPPATVRSTSAKIALFCAISPLLAALAHFMGGGGRGNALQTVP